MNAEVKPGYKLTEVGVIPEDWDVQSLAEIGNIKTGPFGTLLKASEYYAVEGVPLVSVRDIGEGKLTFDEHTPLVPILIVRRMPEYVLNDGDIVFGRKGGVDRSAIVQKHQVGCFLGSDGIRIRPLKVYHALFIAYQLQRKEIQAWLLKNATGTTMPSMNQAILRRISLPIPTKAEQQSIAEALSDADALIESLEQLITKKSQIKQGAMQKLLNPKDGWEKVKLGSLGVFLKGSGVKRDESLSGNIPCIRYGEIYTKHKDYIKAFDSWISSEVAATATRIKCGDILFAGSGETKEEIGKCVAFVDDIDAYAGGDIVILRPNNANSLFLGCYLNTESVNRQKASKGQGDAVVHIGSNALADIDLIIPPVEEQAVVASVLFDMDAEIGALEAKLEKIRQLKQGMMYNLLTGKIRMV